MIIKPDNKKSGGTPPDKTIENQTKNINSINVIEEPEHDSYSDIPDTVSADECTGMMYMPPQNEEELESYKELFSMQTPNNRENSRIQENKVAAKI